MKALISILISMSIFTLKAQPKIDLPPIESFDISRYMGLWYEIARYENKFERGMTRVTATYTLKPNGKVLVLNNGYRNGKWHQAVGKAKFGKPAAPGFLKVSFFLNFYAPYRVIMLAYDYSYAVVSSGENYLWILSRTPQLSTSTLNEILNEVTNRGFDIDKLVFN